jgi:hypothetical protein
MRPICNHVQMAIMRAIAGEVDVDSADRIKPILIVEDVRSIDWASATFVGARHEIDVRLTGEPDAVAAAVERLIQQLPEREIPIAGHIVAEIAATPVSRIRPNLNLTDRHLTVNVLTIID